MLFRSVVQTMNPTRRHPVKTASSLLLACGLAAALTAQESSPASAPATPPTPGAAAEGDDGEMVVLSPFEVNASRDVGYLAQNTLAGSRLNSQLKDTASAISVLTPEFLKDIGATSFADVIQYTNNSVPEYGDSAPNFNANPMIGNQETGLRIRGLPASYTRNYFAWEAPSDFYNVERIDQARGPNAILFGFGSAGGIMNTTTKRAWTNKSFGSVAITLGSWDRYRAALDFNGVLLPDKLALRVNIMGETADSWRQWEYNDERRAHFAARWQIAEKTSLRAEYESGHIEDLVMRPWVAIDQTYAWRAAGSPTFDGANWSSEVVTQQWEPHVVWIENDGTLANWVNQPYAWPNADNNWVHMAMTKENLDIIPVSANAGGPDADRTSDYKTYTLNLEHQFSDSFVAELSYNHQDSDFFGYDPEWFSYQLMADAANWHPANWAANPRAGDLYLENYWARRTRMTDSDFVHLTAAYELNTERLGRYRLAGMYERAWRDYNYLEEINVYAGAPYAWNAEDQPNRVWRRYYITPGDVKDIRPPSWRNPITNQVVGGVTLNSTWVPGQEIIDTTQTQDTLLIGLQALYLEDDRLALTLGYRRDKVEIEETPSARDATTHAWELDVASPKRTADFDADTITVGGVFDLTKRVSIYGNYSTSRAIPNIQQKIIGQDFVPIPESDGQDIGLKFDLFDGRLYATGGYYTTNSNGQAEWGDVGSQVRDRNTHVLDALRADGRISQADYDSHLITANSYLEDRESEGWEFELIANPTAQWRITTNFSINELVKTNIMTEVSDWAEVNSAYWLSEAPADFLLGWGDWDTLGANIGWMNDYIASQQAFEGKQARGERRYNFSVYTNYTFKNGLSIGGGYRYRSANAITVVDDEVFEGRSINLVDASLGYRFKAAWLGDRVVDLQLNVSNLLDSDKFQIYTVTWHDPNQIERIGLQEPRKLTFTARVDF